MKDYLLDILKHTHSLGLFDFVRVTGTDENTRIDAITEDKCFILMGKTNEPVEEMMGGFGLPNLSKLDMLVNCKEYAENADMSLTYDMRDGVNTPVSIKFINEAKDFKNEYRLMSEKVLDEKFKLPSAKKYKWDVEFMPTVASIQRMNFQSSLLSEEANFTLTTNKSNLVCSFGDASNHAGQFNFATNVSGTLNDDIVWPVKYFLPVLKLYDNSTFGIKISGQGIMEINVDSGMSNYKYYIIGSAK